MKRLALLMALMVSCTACAFGQGQNFPGGVGGTFGPNYSLGGGIAQAQTVAPTTPVTNATLVSGYQICFLPSAANTGAAPTIAGSGTSTFSAKPVTKGGSGGLVALVANDWTTTNVACVIYDGTEFQLQNPQAGIVVSGGLNIGSGASAAGATATGGFACVEAASTGWTPTAGQGFIRCDNTLDNYVVSIPLNGATVTPLPVFNAVPAGSKCLQSSGVAGLVAETAGACGTATISGLTTGFLPKASSATAIANSGCDEGITAANTLTCSDTAGLVIPKIGTGVNPPVCAVATSAWCGVESVPPTAVAGVDDLWPDTTDHSWKAHSNGNGIELVALIAPVPIHQTAKTAAITTATLCTAANCGVAGNYTIEWAFTQTTACTTVNAGSGLTFLLTWTDSNSQAHTAVSMPMFEQGTATASLTFHTGATGTNGTVGASGLYNISSNGSIIQYATGLTACATGGPAAYTLDAWVTRKQ